MTSDTTADFQIQYLQMWTEPDAERRRSNIERMWSTDGRLVISSLGATVTGIEDITAHIARVHEENIAAKGLRFAYDQAIEAGDALMLRSSILAPSGDVVSRGADIIFRGPRGRVETAYMFMGVN